MELAAMSPVFFRMFTASSAARRRRTTTDQSLSYPECFEPFRLGCLARAFLHDVKDIFILFANEMKALGVTVNHVACAVALVLVLMYLAINVVELKLRARRERNFRKKRGFVELRLFGDDDERPTEGQMEAAHVLAFLALVYFCVRPEGRDWVAVLLVGVQAGYLALLWRARVARRRARMEAVVRPIVRKHLPVSYELTWREEGRIIHIESDFKPMRLNYGSALCEGF
ncbi:hypothetical protein CMUS01_12995 [Colletotrichum musicola]|uniref:Uncharacterized protein n=1 Tax=Colletotrichum musicola TaxID=2175873 RepID=A0A8H6JHG4_9PEZI|nr:hypothetical protein CMUS01_12995 [Colletotrichum musicola]